MANRSDTTLGPDDPRRLIREREVTAYFQPLIALEDNSIVGYEALARSTVPGLENPGLMFQTAQMVSREVELSLICRQRALEGAQMLAPDARIFVNTHRSWSKPGWARSSRGLEEISA